MFWKKSRRNVEPQKAKELKGMLDSRIKAVGVFLDAEIELVINLLKEGVIDIAQLHGSEDEEYINKVKLETGREVIKAFNVNKLPSLMIAEESPADYIMLDSGTGSGKAFDHRILSDPEKMKTFVEATRDAVSKNRD